MMLRVGLVGVGDAGAQHARALLELAASGALEPGKNQAIVWSAIAARDPARVAAFRAKLGVPESVVTFPTLDALVASGTCDAVILATPDGAHASHVEKVAARGLHVLCEKPLALTKEDGARAIAGAERADVRLAVGYHLRHHAAHRLALARRSEIVGNLRSIYIRWAWPDPAVDGWRARGDGAHFWSLAALGTHAIDLAFMFGGTHVTRVAAMLEPEHGVDRAAEVSFALRSDATESEVLVHVSTSVAHRATSRVLVTGDAGEIEAVGTLGARGDGELFAQAAKRGAPRESIAFVAANPYVSQLRAFAAAIANHPQFTEDPAMLANLDVLDFIRTRSHRQTPPEIGRP